MRLKLTTTILTGSAILLSGCTIYGATTGHVDAELLVLDSAGNKLSEALVSGYGDSKTNNDGVCKMTFKAELTSQTNAYGNHTSLWTRQILTVLKPGFEPATVVMLFDHTYDGAVGELHASISRAVTLRSVRLQ